MAIPTHVFVKMIHRQMAIPTHVFAAARQTEVSKPKQLGQLTVLRKLLIPHHLHAAVPPSWFLVWPPNSSFHPMGKTEIFHHIAVFSFLVFLSFLFFVRFVCFCVPVSRPYNKTKLSWNLVFIQVQNADFSMNTNKKNKTTFLFNNDDDGDDDDYIITTKLCYYHDDGRVKTV